MARCLGRIEKIGIVQLLQEGFRRRISGEGVVCQGGLKGIAGFGKFTATGLFPGQAHGSVGESLNHGLSRCGEGGGPWGQALQGSRVLTHGI